METWLDTAEHCKENYEYAEHELDILYRKKEKSSEDEKRIYILEQIYDEQKYQYFQCVRLAEKTK